VESPRGVRRAEFHLASIPRGAGRLNVIEDTNALYCAIRHGGCGGFQNSVVRARVFSEMLIEPIRVGEDMITIIRAIANGTRVAYVDDIHLILYCHDDNISLAAPKSVDGQLAVGRAFVASLEGLRRELVLTGKESRAMAARIREECFWMTGYPLIQQGLYQEGLAMMWRGLKLAPFNVLYWKTFLLAVLRAAASAMKNREQSCSTSCPSKSSHTAD